MTATAAGRRPRLRPLTAPIAIFGDPGPAADRENAFRALLEPRTIRISAAIAAFRPECPRRRRRPSRIPAPFPNTLNIIRPILSPTPIDILHNIG